LCPSTHAAVSSIVATATSLHASVALTTWNACAKKEVVYAASPSVIQLNLDFLKKFAAFALNKICTAFSQKLVAFSKVRCAASTLVALFLATMKYLALLIFTA